MPGAITEETSMESNTKLDRSLRDAEAERKDRDGTIKKDREEERRRETEDIRHI